MKYTNSIYKFFDSKPTVLYLVIFLMFGLVRLTMLTWDPIGLPDDHDEFSNLLQAEIFASGRFATNQHPLWQHFESFHILQNPTYASKYPPGQAFFLYLGIKFFGHAWYGVLLSCMLMAACLVWMIRGYCSTRWALVAGIFIVLRFALWNYWSSSYWGGAVAATGGALVFGALPRFNSLDRKRLIMASIAFGVGLIFLSLSRPFEGLLVALIPGLYLLKLVINALRKDSKSTAAYLLIPVSALVLLNFAFSAYYNYKVTGEFLKMPYSLHSEQYSVQPPFLLLSKKASPPTYNHDLFKKYYQGWELIEIDSVKDYLSIKKWHFEKFIRFFYYWPLLVGVCFLFIDRKGIEIPYWTFLLFCAHILITSWFHPHYFAPALAIYYLLLIHSIKYLIDHKNKVIRQLAVVCLPIFLIITFANTRFFATRHSGYINGTQEYINQKQRIIEKLSQTNENHIILVKYSDEHELHKEWVYNGPNLNQSKILWARYMSEEKTNKLKQYFKDRKLWIINADEPSSLAEY